MTATTAAATGDSDESPGPSGLSPDPCSSPSCSAAGTSGRRHSPQPQQLQPSSSSSASSPPHAAPSLSYGTMNLIAGTAGGFAGVLAGQPFDTIKVRLQCHSQRRDLPRLVVPAPSASPTTTTTTRTTTMATTTTTATPSVQYRGTLHCLREIVRHESVLGLFKGMSSPLVGVALVNALLFGVYGWLLQVQMGRGGGEGGGGRDDSDDNQPSLAATTTTTTTATTALSPTLGQIYWAGAGSGLINSFISCPMELAKIKLQMQSTSATSTTGPPPPVPSPSPSPSPPPSPPTPPVAPRRTPPHYTSPLQCLRSLVATHGVWRGAFRGLVPTIVRETPSYAAYFCTYEALCRALAPAPPTQPALQPWQLMLAGGVSGVAGWLSTYPADVIKTKIQASDVGVYSGFIQCARHTVACDGMAGLWRGVTATVVRAFPTNAATFVVWHHMMDLLKQY